MDQRKEIAKRNLLPIFTSRVLRELVSFGSSSRVEHARIALESHSLIENEPPIREVFERSYNVLRAAYPSEYVLLTECLSSQTPCGCRFASFRELAVGTCRADLAVFDEKGLSHGYEIKSQFDHLGRLRGQLATYQQVFSRTYVVTDGPHLHNVLQNLPDSIGVICFSNDELREFRAAGEAPDLICSSRLFSLLRKTEYLRVIRAEFGSVPRCSNTEIYRVCLELFRQINPAKAQLLVTEALRARQEHGVVEDDPAWRLPRALRGLTLTGSLNRLDRLRLVDVLEQ